MNVYYYLCHLLTKLPEMMDEDGNIEQSKLEAVMPWSKGLPLDCYNKRRQ